MHIFPVVIQMLYLFVLFQLFFYIYTPKNTHQKKHFWVDVLLTIEDEYLIRDKWGYCTTANHVESEHFIIFYGNNDTTG